MNGRINLHFSYCHENNDLFAYNQFLTDFFLKKFIVIDKLFLPFLQNTEKSFVLFGIKRISE